jgi:hypothetical protein
MSSCLQHLVYKELPLLIEGNIRFLPACTSIPIICGTQIIGIDVQAGRNLIFPSMRRGSSL